MRRIVEFFGLSFFFTLVIGGAFLGGYYARALSGAYTWLRLPLPGLPSVDGDYALLTEVSGLLRTHYNGILPDEKTLTHGAARGYVNAVGDPYTVLIDPPAAELENQSLSGEYGGIGVEIRRNEKNEIALYPFPDSPALAAGVTDGDILIAIDGKAITPQTSTDEVVALVRGLVDTTVEITVRKANGEEHTLTITRKPIPIPSVTWHMVEGQSDIGLITLSRFSDKTPDEFKRAAAELQAQGAARLVIDLRNNGGGLLDSAIGVATQLLDGGVVMYEKGKTGPEKTFNAPASGEPLTRLPLAVLINGNTASAAEIVAGALLDRGRAVLIGQKTYGKGSVQFVFPLSDGSSLHVTSNLWYTPSHRPLDKNGLQPTIPVEPAADGQDVELARAVEYLTNGQ
jgi:carboxyl-terminal processing protease